MTQNSTNSSVLMADYTPVEVIGFNTPDSKKDFTKEKLNDGNVLYTVKYYQVGSTPNFTKILVGPNNETLAFIDVQRIKPQFKSNWKKWRWFNIQEFNPGLIGDFTHAIAEKQYESFYGCTWDHVSDSHTYILGDKIYQECFSIIDDNHIRSNFGLDYYDYNCKTHPGLVLRIERLKRQILLTDGTITEKEMRWQKIHDFFTLKR